jgi:colicin import membrane protein
MSTPMIAVHADAEDEVRRRAAALVDASRRADELAKEKQETFAIRLTVMINEATTAARKAICLPAKVAAAAAVDATLPIYLTVSKAAAVAEFERAAAFAALEEAKAALALEQAITAKDTAWKKLLMVDNELDAAKAVTALEHAIVAKNAAREKEIAAKKVAAAAKKLAAEEAAELAALDIGYNPA